MKNFKAFLILLAALLNPGLVVSQKPYDARIGEREILTPLPGKSARINGPKIYGIRPGKKNIYRIPCQGERPVPFTAEGLPEVLILDADN